jgi:multiple sugar transport system substrate-binding protein
MRRSLYRFLTALVAVSMVLTASFAGVQARSVHRSATAPMTLHIAWFAWAPANALQTLGNYYHAHVNPNVTIKVDEPPASQWHDYQFTQFAAHHTSFQIAIPDSQWIGEGVVGHDFVDLTNWIKHNLPIKDFYPYLFAAYSQYPQRKPGQTGSLDLKHAHFYGVPLNSDALGWMYRKDLFNNPANQKAFFKRYHWHLGPPHSYDQIMQIAQFFTRPSQHLWGVGVHESNSYDASAEFFNETLWNFGGDLWNPTTGQIEGIINNTRGQAALTWDKKLTAYAPPGSGNWWFTEVTNAFAQGEIAMANQWWDFMPDQWLHGPTKLGKTPAEIKSKIGYFAPPGETFMGKHSQVAALGGMGAAISAYDTPAQIKASEAFLKWVLSPKAQFMAVALGLGPCRKSVLNSARFRKLVPYAVQMNQSFRHLRDFWNVPDYAIMLTTESNDLNKVFVNEMSVTDALNDIARVQQHALCSGVKRGVEPHWSYCIHHPNA